METLNTGIGDLVFGVLTVVVLVSLAVQFNKFRIAMVGLYMLMWLSISTIAPFYAALFIYLPKGKIWQAVACLAIGVVLFIPWFVIVNGKFQQARRREKAWKEARKQSTKLR